jgi:hypothetical protein
MKNVLPKVEQQTYPRIQMNTCQLYLAQHKVHKEFVTAMLLNKEILIIGTGGFSVAPHSRMPATEFFQDHYSIIRTLSKGEQVVLEV